MDSQQLLKLVIDVAQDLKAQDIVQLDVQKLGSITDYMVIASGSSNRQVIAIAEHIVQQSKQQGFQPLGVEGEKEGEWVLVDLGDVVAHIMQPQVRDFYQLEKLWSGFENPAEESHTG